MMITVASHFLRRKGSKLRRHLAKITLLVFSRITGKLLERSRISSRIFSMSLTSVLSSLLTVGRTVDEAAILYSMLDNACHSQLMAEAAAANGIPKRIINNEVAQYTAEFAQNPVSLN